MAVDLGVVVVAYESEAVLPALLGDLRRYEPAARVVVVDNASPSGAPEVHGSATLVRHETNAGYAAACNTGARHFGGDVTHLAFLNPDVRLTGPSLTQLAGALAAVPDAGVASGPVRNEEGNRTPSAWGPTSVPRALWAASGWRLPRLRAALGRVARRGLLSSGASMAHDGFEVAGHVLGGAMVVDARCFAELGGFDEDYFMFWEDADLCFRARQHGWSVQLLPCDPMVHQEGTSSRGVTADQRWRWYVDGARLFAAKHLSRGRGRTLHAALVAGRALRRR